MASTSEKVRLFAQQGMSASEITHQTRLPRSTVKYHLKRYKETGSWNRREYPIRVKTLTPFAAPIEKHLKNHPHASATELHELLASRYHVNVSVRTVQRYLKTTYKDKERRHNSPAYGAGSSNTSSPHHDSSDSEESTTEDLTPYLPSSPHNLAHPKKISDSEEPTPELLPPDLKTPPILPAAVLSHIPSKFNNFPSLPHLPYGLPYPISSNLLPLILNQQASIDSNYSLTPSVPLLELQRQVLSSPLLPLNPLPNYSHNAQQMFVPLPILPWHLSGLPSNLPPTLTQSHAANEPTAPTPSLNALLNAALIGES